MILIIVKITQENINNFMRKFLNSSKILEELNTKISVVAKKIFTMDKVNFLFQRLKDKQFYLKEIYEYMVIINPLKKL